MCPTLPLPLPQVSIVPFQATTTITSAYTTHLVLVCFLGVLLGLGCTVLVWVLCMGEGFASLHKSPDPNPTGVYPHIGNNTLALALLLLS